MSQITVQGDGLGDGRWRCRGERYGGTDTRARGRRRKAARECTRDAQQAKSKSGIVGMVTKGREGERRAGVEARAEGGAGGGVEARAEGGAGGGVEAEGRDRADGQKKVGVDWLVDWLVGDLFRPLPFTWPEI